MKLPESANGAPNSFIHRAEMTWQSKYQYGNRKQKESNRRSYEHVRMQSEVIKDR